MGRFPLDHRGPARPAGHTDDRADQVAQQGATDAVHAALRVGASADPETR